MPTYIVQHGVGFEVLKGSLLFVIYYLVFLLIAFIPIKKILDKTVKPFLNIDVGKYWNTIWFIPIALLITLSFMIPHNEHVETIGHLVGHAMLAVVLVSICLSIANDYNSIKEQKEMREHIDKSKLYYVGLKNKMDEARKKNHDLKHLLLSIRHYIDTDDKTGLSDFCDDIEQNYFNKDIIPYTGNVSIDGIIFHYIQLCKMEKINFHYVGNIKNDGVSDIDLCVLLGNALDNAYTACLKVEEPRKISLISQSEENVLSIVVQNTFDGKMDVEKDVIFSRKRDKEQGIGLKSMKEICEKYQGNLEIQWDDEKFTILIMLPINKTDVYEMVK
jgi:sensor histidine kinase YesM